MVFRVHFHAVRQFRFERLRFTQAIFQPVFENVRHRDDLDVVRAVQNVLNGLRTAAAATNKSGSEFLVAGATYQFRPDNLEGGCACD